jgi:hypothetical protein
LVVIPLQVTEVAVEEQEVSVGPVQLILHPLEHVMFAWHPSVFQDGAGIHRSPTGGICSWATSSAWKRGVVDSKEAQGDSCAVIGTEKRNRKKRTRKTKPRSCFMGSPFFDGAHYSF